MSNDERNGHEILWVEDVPRSIRANWNELERRGFDLMSTKSLHSAQLALEQNHFRLIFVDYSLPEIDGEIPSEGNSLGIKLIEDIRSGKFGERNAEALIGLCTAQNESIGQKRALLRDLATRTFPKLSSYFDILDMADEIRGEMV